MRSFELVAEGKLTPQVQTLDQSARKCVEADTGAAFARRSVGVMVAAQRWCDGGVGLLVMVHVWGVQTYCAAETQPCATSENVGSRCLFGVFEQACPGRSNKNTDRVARCSSEGPDRWDSRPWAHNLSARMGPSEVRGAVFPSQQGGIPISR